MENQRKRDMQIIFICWLAYAAAYVGRLNYSASMVAVISDLSVSKDAAGLVGSFFFFAYGIGQLVNGVLSGRYNAKIMVFLSLFISAGLNIAMAACGDIGAMKYIWLANGAVQSVLWCTLIKTVSERVHEDMIPKAILIMSTPNIAGTFAAYGLSALFVRLGRWRGVFFVAAAVLAVTSVIWLTLFGKPEKAVQHMAEQDEKQGRQFRFLLPALVAAVFAGVANGFVKDGINTWTTSVLYEECHVSQSFSILLTLTLPLVAAAGAILVEKIHKKIQSHTKMNLLFYLVSAVMCGCLLPALRIHSLPLVLLCFAGLSCLMSMINNVVTSVFPLDNRRYLGAGMAAGVLNAFCYAGSTVTSYSLGILSEKKGWTAVFAVMLGICMAAALVCFVCGKKEVLPAEGVNK